MGLANKGSWMQKSAAFHSTTERVIWNLKRPQAFCYLDFIINAANQDVKVSWLYGYCVARLQDRPYRQRAFVSAEIGQLQSDTRPESLVNLVERLFAARTRAFDHVEDKRSELAAHQLRVRVVEYGVILSQLLFPLA